MGVGGGGGGGVRDRISGREVRPVSRRGGIDTPFKTKNPENNTLSGHTFPFSPYKGVPPVCCVTID